MPRPETGERVLATNRKALFHYEVLERAEAGLALVGTEVKSIREGGLNFSDSWVDIRGGELFLVGCRIAPYSHGNYMNHVPGRDRKLLLHKPEILKLGGKVTERGVTLVPLRAYLKNGRVKMEIGLARGKHARTAHETTRYHDRAKIIGPLSRQLYYVRTGIADVVVTDEQCVRTDLLDEARKVGTAFIATSDKACYGLEDATEKDPDEIVREMVEYGKQFLILDPQKAGEVAVRVAVKLAPQRRSHLISDAEASELAKKCVQCDMCERVCPNMLDISVGISPRWPKATSSHYVSCSTSVSAAASVRNARLRCRMDFRLPEFQEQAYLADVL